MNEPPLLLVDETIASGETSDARQAAHQLAGELLAQGLPRPAIRERLMELGLSRRTAYRVLEALSATSPITPTHQPAMDTLDTTTELDTFNPTCDTADAVTPQPTGLLPLKVRVTHLRAPWPDGTVVGSIVQFPGSDIPSWAAGKCQPAEGDATVEFTWSPPVSEIARPAVTLPAWALALGAPDRGQQLVERRRALAGVVDALPAARERVSRSEVALRSMDPADGAWHPGVPLSPNDERRSRIDDLRREQKDAVQHERALVAQQQGLAHEVEQLERVVSANQRLKPAQDAHAAAVKQHEAAVQRVRLVEAAIERLDREVAAEQQAVAEGRRCAAASLLERAKAGTSLDEVEAPNEGRLNALRQARADAVDALAAAKAEANEADRLEVAAGREVWAVIADRQMAELDRTHAAFVEAAGTWSAAVARATGRMPPLPDVMGAVQSAAERALEQAEAD